MGASATLCYQNQTRNPSSPLQWPNQFCQTEHHVDDKETQSETVVNATSVNTQTEPKPCVDIALSPVKLDSPIRTHNTIISPIGSSTPIKPEFQIRIPQVDSVGGLESESVLLQENVVSTRMWSNDTSVANGSKSSVMNSDITIDSSNESYAVSTKEIVSLIQTPSSAANVLQHEEIKQSTSTVGGYLRKDALKKEVTKQVTTHVEMLPA